MLLRIALFTLLAVGLAGFATVGWVTLHQAPPPDEVATQTQDQTIVVAAATMVRAGMLLKPEDLTGKSLPRSAQLPGARIDSSAARAELYGAMVRRTLTPGDVILPADVVRPGERGFLAAVLAPGMRAATVGVDAISGTAGLIWPGDHVDLILTQTMDDQTLPRGRRVVGETVLADVRVIAIDQQMVRGASGLPEFQQARTVTLEATPSQAEQIAVATRLGRLSLTVRSVDSVQLNQATSSRDADANRVTWGGDVSPALGGDHANDTAPRNLHVFEGNADGKDFHF